MGYWLPDGVTQDDIDRAYGYDLPDDEDDDRCIGCGAGFREACEEWCTEIRGVLVSAEEIGEG